MKKKIYIFMISFITISIAFFAYNFFTNQKTQETDAAASRTGLVAHWDMDSESINGATVYDKSGQGNNGTITGATVIKGKIGQALDFSGSSQNVSYGNDPSIQNGTSKTISMWINPDEISAVQSKRLIHKYDDADNSYIVSLGINSNRIIGQFESGGTTYVESSTSGNIAEVNKWSHIIAVFNGSSATVYLNGVDVSGGGLVFVTPSAATSGVIGADGAGLNAFNGQIDDVRIYNKALSAQEVANLYNSAKTNYTQAPTRKGLIGHWDMDSESINGTTVYDKSGQNNHGVGANINSDDLVAGKIGQALDFAFPEYIDIASTNGFPDVMNNITLAFWGNFTSFSQPYNFRAVPDDTANRLALSLGWGGTNIFWDFGNTGAGRLTKALTTDQFTEMAHWVFTYEDGVGSKIYRNNVLIASSVTSGTFTKGAKTLQIGWSTYGLYDDVRIYDYALSAQEVANLYNSAKTNYTQAPSRTGLVGWWDMDSKSINGVNVYDKSGNNNHAVYNGASGSPTSTVGKIGQAILFQNNDSTNGGLSVANFLSDDQFTFGFWLKKDGTMAKASYIIDNEGVGGLNPGFGVVINAGATFPVIYYDDGTVQRVVQNTALNILDNQWHFIVGTKDLSDNVKLYVDGVYKAGSAVAIGDVSSNDGLTIGWSGLAGGSGFDGSLDDVRVYNYALSAQEVANLYSSSRKTYMK